jgi:CENP-S protein
MVPFIQAAMSKDLRAFSRHGKRSTVNNDDVKLLARYVLILLMPSMHSVQLVLDYHNAYVPEVYCVKDGLSFHVHN